MDAQFTKEQSEALSSTDSDFVTTTVSPRSVSSSLEQSKTQKEITSVEDAAALTSLCPSFSTTTTPTTSADTNLYRQYYFRNPCVPVDFSSINEALKHCPRTKKNPLLAGNDKSVVYSDVGTVVLMPGVYVDERIDIGGEPWSVGQPTFDRCVAIRAAFPLLGATICSPPHPKEEDVDDDAVPLLNDQPCISISTVDEDALEGIQKGISVRLSHLRILHSAPGVSPSCGIVYVLYSCVKAGSQLSTVQHNARLDRLIFGAAILLSVLMVQEHRLLLIPVSSKVIQAEDW